MYAIIVNNRAVEIGAENRISFSIWRVYCSQQNNQYRQHPTSRTSSRKGTAINGQTPFIFALCTLDDFLFAPCMEQIAILVEAPHTRDYASAVVSSGHWYIWSNSKFLLWSSIQSNAIFSDIQCAQLHRSDQSLPSRTLLRYLSAHLPTFVSVLLRSITLLTSWQQSLTCYLRIYLQC